MGTLPGEKMFFLEKIVLLMIESAFQKKLYLGETVTDTGGNTSLTLTHPPSLQSSACQLTVTSGHPCFLSDPVFL